MARASWNGTVLADAPTESVEVVDGWVAFWHGVTVER
jgi:uncharacterized protein (DUF427 family)